MTPNIDMHNPSPTEVLSSTTAIPEFYSQNRCTWDQLYPSERWVFDRIAKTCGSLGSILDVGCAVGGLGRALAEHLPISAYKGIDINRQAIAAAQANAHLSTVPTRFQCGDVQEKECLDSEVFDCVVSLACADWNLEPAVVLNRCWECVAPGGHLIVSLRLTTTGTVTDFTQSYQYLHFGDPVGMGNREKVNYVVYNVLDALHLLSTLPGPPGHILGYGYWGSPSPSAVTPFERLIFTVFALHRVCPADDGPRLELHLPANALTPNVDTTSAGCRRHP